jgi:hypothetical protein
MNASLILNESAPAAKPARTTPPKAAPAPRTIYVSYHGTDEFTFSSAAGEKVKRIDRFGYKHTYKSLERAIHDFFADKQHLPTTIARWLDCRSITVSEARHIVLRLKNEGVEGFEDIKPSDVAGLPRRLEARGVSLW